MTGNNTTGPRAALECKPAPDARLEYWRGVLHCWIALWLAFLLSLLLSGCSASEPGRRAVSAPAVNVGPLGKSISAAQLAALSAGQKAALMRRLLQQDAKLVKQL